MHGIGKKCIQILVIKSEGKRTFVLTKHRWEVDTKMELSQGFCCTELIRIMVQYGVQTCTTYYSEQNIG